MNLQCLVLTFDRDVILARAFYPTENGSKRDPKARQQEVVELDRAALARSFIARTSTLARRTSGRLRNRGWVR